MADPKDSARVEKMLMSYVEKLTTDKDYMRQAKMTPAEWKDEEKRLNRSAVTETSVVHVQPKLPEVIGKELLAFSKGHEKELVTYMDALINEKKTIKKYIPEYVPVASSTPSDKEIEVVSAALPKLTQQQQKEISDAVNGTIKAKEELMKSYEDKSLRLAGQLQMITATQAKQQFLDSLPKQPDKKQELPKGKGKTAMEESAWDKALAQVASNEPYTSDKLELPRAPTSNTTYLG